MGNKEFERFKEALEHYEYFETFPRTVTGLARWVYELCPYLAVIDEGVHTAVSEYVEVYFAMFRDGANSALKADCMKSGKAIFDALLMWNWEWYETLFHQCHIFKRIVEALGD